MKLNQDQAVEIVVALLRSGTVAMPSVVGADDRPQGEVFGFEQVKDSMRQQAEVHATYISSLIERLTAGELPKRPAK